MKIAKIILAGTASARRLWPNKRLAFSQTGAITSNKAAIALYLVAS
jgi:hypothetical protein